MGRLCALVPQGCSVSSGLQVLRHWPPPGQAGLPVLETLFCVWTWQGGSLCQLAHISAAPQYALEEALLPISRSGSLEHR